MDKSKRGCDTCKHYHEWQESRPWGSTTASETLAECNSPDAPEEFFDAAEFAFPMVGCPYWVDAGYCPECGGEGFAGENYDKCAKCGGTGHVTEEQGAH